VNVKTLHVDGHNVATPEHITHHHTLRFKGTKQSRICAHMQLSDPGGRVFHVFNTHLSLPTPFTKEFWSVKEKMGYGINQLHEARTLASYCASPFMRGAVHRSAGDFNSAPASRVFKYLVEEATVRVRPGDARSSR